MDQKEAKRIKFEKRTGYNVYGVKDRVFWIIAGLLVGATFASVLDTMIVSFPLAFRLEAEIALVVLITAFFCVRNAKRGNRVEPYLRSDGFEFLGLYNIGTVENLESRDILSRKDEAAYIRQTLEDYVFSQKNIKQAVCLTGASGCGKSTILSFFRKMYGQDYEIIDMTDNYLDFRVELERHLGSDMAQEIVKRTQNKKMIFILDQFERYFFLEETKKKDVRDLIMTMSRRNTAIILSMREEYLADLMKEFNVNNLKISGRNRDGSSQTGIINSLVSTVRDAEKNYFTVPEKSRASVSNKWFDGLYKANQHIHLEHAGGAFEDTVLERVGDTIFYCENQNETYDEMGNRIVSTNPVMQSRCERLFGDRGVRFFEKHKAEPLIQQQINFHMAEYEKKRKRSSPEQLQAMFELEDYELINHYFDTQLTSTGDYYNASRILYLLSSARLNQVVMRQEDIEFGLFANQFSEDGHKKLPDVVQALEELQLIRRNIKDSDIEFEIAHDFIAQAYLNYSSSHIDRNVQGALNIYMSEYLDTSKKSGIEEKRKHFIKVRKSHYYRNLTIAFMIIAVVAAILVNFVYNPWLGPWSHWNAYGEVRSLFPLLGTELSIIYLFNMYHKVLRFCRGKKERTCKISYVVVMAGAAVTMLFYPHNMAFVGGFLAVMGFVAAFLLDGTYQRASRMELRNYGLKCAMIGIAFAIFHVVIWAFNYPVMPRYLIVTEMIMICVLVGYAYMAHMTREHLYGRIMDASSERVTK